MRTQATESALGWNDLLLFFDFRKWTHCCQSSMIFLVQFQKNRQILVRSRQSFNFQKITGTLKINIFWENLQIPSFYINEHSRKRKIGIKNA